uniref:Ig-like domain-containing protein n=1 Tax=Paramormyrops kingsleyae TaxID=1676925 RepID=A0A3B3Q3T0_9TELE
EDIITSLTDQVSAVEGENITLSCKYSTSDEIIQWYRQYSRSAPEYLLYTAEFAKERFSSKADKSSGRAPLSISNVQLGDSAVYYCALGTTGGALSGTPLSRLRTPTSPLIAVFPPLWFRPSSPLPPQFCPHFACLPHCCNKLRIASLLNQKEKELFKEEGERTSLECTFSTSSTSYYVYWYRQYPGTAPEFILRSGSSSYTAEFAKQRFSSNADRSSGKAPLSISNVQLGDSAVYYCALQTTVMN